MSIKIQMAEDNRSAIVNGKNVHQDANDNWLATGEQLTYREREELYAFLKSIKRASAHACRVRRTKNRAS